MPDCDHAHRRLCPHPHIELGALDYAIMLIYVGFVIESVLPSRAT